MNNTEAYYDSELHAVIWKIKGFVTLNDFIKVSDETHSLRKDNKSNKQLNNISDMKVLSADVQSYIENTYFVKAIESGLKYFAFVVPDNTFGKISMEKVNMGAKEKYGIDIKYFNSEDKAKEWLNSK